MQIIITPNDIIQRCLWDKYRKYVLYDIKESEVQKLVDENKPVSLSEEDAYAIGLLKIIETDNLVHRFNENILDTLQIKSNIIKDELYINKTVITKEITSYLDKFPDYFKAPFNYKESLIELEKYIENIQESVSELEITNVKNREKIFLYYMSKDIRKCLKL